MSLERLVNDFHTLPKGDSPLDMERSFLGLFVAPSSILIDFVSHHDIPILRRAFPRAHARVAARPKKFHIDGILLEIVVSIDNDCVGTFRQGAIVPNGFHGRVSQSGIGMH